MLRAGLRRRVERVDHLRVDELVHLEDDAAARPRLPPDQLADAPTQVMRRDEQLAVVARWRL